MSLRPRRLRLLRIDDDIDRGGGEDSIAYREDRALASIEMIEVRSDGQPVPGIKSWRYAIEFWSAYDPKMKFDLILSDVRFYDASSPLASLTPELGSPPLPTGISHFKAFAALSRAQGRLLGVGLHTKEPQTWSDLAKSGNRELHFVALLAAHEIGELAAILGEADELHGRDAEACWNWLQQRTVRINTFRDALPSALQQFRKRLGAVRLLPNDYQQLVEWCGRMEASAGAGSSPEDPAGILLTEDEDRGFPVPEPDGKRDLVSLRSLFTDVMIESPRFDFDYGNLPRKCFELKPDEEFYKLDNGMPKIGALVYKCGELGRAYKTALEIVGQFPASAGRNAKLNLAVARDAAGGTSLDTAIAIFLKDIEREYAIHSTWRALYTNYAWHPVADAFTGEQAASKGVTLQSWLGRVSARLALNHSIRHETIMEMFEGADYDRSDPSHGLWPATDSFVARPDEDVADATEADDLDDDDPLPDDEVDRDDEDDAEIAQKRRGWPGTRRCISLLTSLDIVRWEAAQRTFVPGARQFSLDLTPPCPKRPPMNFLACSNLGDDYCNGRDRLYKPQASLRKLFGYGTDDNNNIVQRTIGGAFGTPGEGKEFIDLFRNGRAPVSWIKEVCRGYARELGWDESSWPKSLRD